MTLLITSIVLGVLAYPLIALLTYRGLRNHSINWIERNTFKQTKYDDYRLIDEKKIKPLFVGRETYDHREITFFKEAASLQSVFWPFIPFTFLINYIALGIKTYFVEKETWEQALEKKRQKSESWEQIQKLRNGSKLLTSNAGDRDSYIKGIIDGEFVIKNEVKDPSSIESINKAVTQLLDKI